MKPSLSSRPVRRLICGLMLASLSLSACSLAGPTPMLPAGPSQQQGVKPLLSSALLKRTLQLQQINGQVVPVAAVTPQSERGFGIQQVATAIAISEPAVSRPAIAPGYYYGGHDFNQYTIQYAEENIYPGAQGTLLSVYESTVKGILNEWDASARLIESRAQLNAQDDEYIHLPGHAGEPQRIRPDFVFRFASTPRKETLNVYVMGNETRVHRMVWGEPQIQIERVQIDSDQAVSIAQQAFASRNDQPGYPVYPTLEDAQRDRNIEVVYDIPSELQWHVQLNQQSRDQLRYFLNFSYRDTPSVSRPEVMAASSDQANSPLATSTIDVAPQEFFYQPHLYGSIEIDAITGEIKSLNRPMIYRPVVEEGKTSSGSASMGFPSSLVDPLPPTEAVNDLPVSAQN